MRELEKILEDIEEYRNHVCEDYSRGIEFVAGAKRVFNGIDHIIRKHMNDGWIPVEKDLPKNESTVWVVLEAISGSGYKTYSSARYLHFENYGESHWYDNRYGYLEWDKYSDGRGGCSLYKVVAWMPIEPYRPERSDG